MPAAAQNLLRNGGFEGPVADDIPQNWMFHDFRADALASGKVETKSKFGRQSLLLQAPAFPADFTAFCRPLDVDDLQGHEVLFSCYYRTEEHPQALVTLSTYAEDFTPLEFRTPELHSESHPIGESKDWRLYVSRLTIPEGAEQLVVMLRIQGGGKVWWDGVSVRPVGGEVEVSVEDAGTVESLPDRRVVRCRLRNVTKHELPLVLHVEASDDQKVRRREKMECRLAPDQSRVVEVGYKYNFDEPHLLTVRLEGAEADTLHEYREQQTPGLVDARVTQPAFRSLVLSSLPTDEIVITGRLNASPQIARLARVSASLVGTGAFSADPEMMTDRGLLGNWQITLPATGMLTGRYQVDVTAEVEDRKHTLSIPVERVPQAPAETAYDARNRLWVNGEAIFPIGIYEVVFDSDLPRVAEAGFNFTITPSRMVSYNFADAAKEAGVGIFLASDTLDGQFWQHTTRKYFGHPAMLGWYGLDLPDTKAVMLATLREAYVHATTGPYPAMAEMDPRRPVLLSLRPNSMMDQYAELADIVLAWSDPVPRWPITIVADAVETAREAVDGRKPVWAIIQSSGYRWLNEMSTTPVRDDRVPTPDENRAMVYLALMAGADGVVYHAFGMPAIGQRPSYLMHRDAPELWAGILETNRQLAELAPVLLEARPEPIELGYDSPVRVASWHSGDTKYVVAVNTQDTTAAIAFDIGAEAGAEVGVPFENRCVIATDSGDIGDIFRPYEVHVYKIGG